MIAVDKRFADSKQPAAQSQHEYAALLNAAHDADDKVRQSFANYVEKTHAMIAELQQQHAPVHDECLRLKMEVEKKRRNAI